jgi:hypothetical protein
MPKCQTIQHPVMPVPERTKILMPNSVRYRDKGTQSDSEVLQYWTDIWDARIPMTAASATMLMPALVRDTDQDLGKILRKPLIYTVL